MINLSMQRYFCGQVDASTLVLLHGWGYSKCAWPHSWLQILAKSYDLCLVDLPGHGDDTCKSLQDRDLQILDTWIQKLAATLPVQYSLLGWSLGGQIAWYLARLFPERVKVVITLSSSPSFVQRKYWHYAMPMTVLQQFINAFNYTANKTLYRFCALQAKGTDQSKLINKCLREQVQYRASMAIGLDWLEILDLRDTWQDLSMPCFLLLATEDALIPAALVDDLRKLNAVQTIEIVKGCHALAWQYALAKEDSLLPRISDFLVQ